MNRNAPIGIFDSGMGGLSVWRELRAQLPHESVVYLADGKNCPYGDRSPEEIAALTREAVEVLLAHGAKLIIVACNTATAMAIDFLREHYDIPFVGMEPAVKPAALATKSGTIGILATRAALAGGLFKATSHKYASVARILSAVGEGFVEAVEEGREGEPATVELVRAALEPMLREGADQIVLGCTHYPFLEAPLREVIGEREVTLVNPAPAVARRAKWLLEEADMLAEEGHKAECRFLTFADEDYRHRVEQKALEIAPKLEDKID
ncbi:MAG: glutamate racemase [Tidjanibacter sp.]|nr:glutamate racemase [Tidjanibacter sp.]